MRPTVALSPGQNMPAPLGELNVRLRPIGRGEPELVALLLDSQGRVGVDADFVFYNAPKHPTGSVELVADALRIDPARIPAAVERLVVAVHNGAGGLPGVAVVVSTTTEELSFAPQQLDDLPTAVLIEIYRRAGAWRVRAVGQGWATGLAGLATDYGVVVDDGHEQAPATTQDYDRAQSEVAELLRRRDVLSEELATLTRQLQHVRAALVETDERMLLQQVGYYQFRHPLDDVLASKQRLDALRAQIKQAISKRTAVHGKSEWMVNGSLKEGQTLVRQFGDLMLRTYNIEADNCVRTVRAHTVDVAAQRLERTREAIVKNGKTMGVAIDESFHALRLAELQLTADHHLRVEQEKEDARAERARQREEVRAQEEFRQRRKDLLKEQAHYRGLLERCQRNGDPIGEAEARERLAEIADTIEQVEEMAANTRVGHVYVISNVGAFGERMVKIGMTRREDPMQRIYELGSASVPFRFDVHALVFSRDAVALEGALHREFDDQRVNRVNRRREFFRVSLAEVRLALEKVGSNHLVEFRDLPEAPEWRQSQALQYTDGPGGVRLDRDLA